MTENGGEEYNRSLYCLGDSLCRLGQLCRNTPGWVSKQHRGSASWEVQGQGGRPPQRAPSRVHRSTCHKAVNLMWRAEPWRPPHPVGVMFPHEPGETPAFRPQPIWGSGTSSFTHHGSQKQGPKYQQRTEGGARLRGLLGRSWGARWLHAGDHSSRRVPRGLPLPCSTTRLLGTGLSLSRSTAVPSTHLQRPLPWPFWTLGMASFVTLPKSTWIRGAGWGWCRGGRGRGGGGGLSVHMDEMWNQ